MYSCCYCIALVLSYACRCICVVCYAYLFAPCRPVPFPVQRQGLFLSHISSGRLTPVSCGKDFV